MAYLTLILTLPLTAFAVLFALSNSGDVKVGLWPLDQDWTLPVNLFGLGMLGAGFFLGALFVWIQYQKLRFRHWQETRKSARLEKELDVHRQGAAKAAETAGAPLAVPALQGAPHEKSA